MQVIVNSANIVKFGFKTTLDVANKSVIFDIAALTEFVGAGGTLIQGINFSINDSSGNPLITGNSGNGTYDWATPNILVPSTDANPDYAGFSTYTLDLSAIWGDNFEILFQTYKIQGAIKDEDGTVYQTASSVQKVCQPKGLTDLGYLPGKFLIKADCPNGFLSVKDITDTTYNGKEPASILNTGTLYYPRGTAEDIPYEEYEGVVNFTNNIVYTGNYKIVNTATAAYEFEDDFWVLLDYYTSSEKNDVTCEKVMLSIMCCLTDFELSMKRHCTGNQAAAMKEQWREAGVYLAIGLGKEASGRDASEEAAKIRKILNCECGKSAINKVSPDPVNPLVYSIVVNGQYGTTVVPTVLGNTKTFTVKSNVYIVSKGNSLDTGFSIDTVTGTGFVRYQITFNYQALAANILTAIGGDTTLITTLNSLITVNQFDISNLDGKCIIDIDATNYFLSVRLATAATSWTSIKIGSTTHTAPVGLLVSNESGAETWLNSLGFGTFSVGYSSTVNGTFLNVLSNDNANGPVNIILTNASGTITALFQKTTQSLLAFLQATADYVCSLQSGDIALGQSLSICSFDYNGQEVSTALSATDTQAQFNAAVAAALCMLVGKVADCCSDSTCVPPTASSSTTLPAGVVGDAYSFAITLAGTSLAIGAQTLPSWMTASLASNVLTFSGTPDAAGSPSVSITIQNACGSLTIEQTIVITECTAPAVADLALPDATNGEEYSYSIPITGSAPFSIDPESVVKPTWMTIGIVGSAVVFGGTPGATAGPVDVSFNVINCSDTPGPYDHTITVIDPLPEVTFSDVSACVTGLQPTTFKIHATPGTVLGLSLRVAGFFNPANTVGSLNVSVSGSITNPGGAPVGNAVSGYYTYPGYPEGTSFNLNSADLFEVTVDGTGIVDVTTLANIENGGTGGIISGLLRVETINGSVPATVPYQSICVGYSTGGGS